MSWVGYLCEASLSLQIQHGEEKFPPFEHYCQAKIAVWSLVCPVAEFLPLNTVKTQDPDLSNHLNSQERNSETAEKTSYFASLKTKYKAPSIYICLGQCIGYLLPA